MRRIVCALLILGGSWTSAAADEGRHQLTGAVDFSALLADSALPSWIEGGNGKLRFDGDHDGILANRAFLDYRGRITNTLFGQVVANVNGDGDDWLDVTEAYLEWRPLPRSEWRLRSRVGAFYPRLSMENTGKEDSHLQR